MALGKQGILRHTGGCKTREVHVPAWRDDQGDDVVVVRGMTVREFELNQSRADDGKATASVLARCIIDPNGGRIFDDGDVGRLAELPMAEIAPLSRAVMELSGLGSDAEGDSEVDKAITDAEGNSESTTGDDSGSV